MALGRGVWGGVQIPAKARVYPQTETLPQDGCSQERECLLPLEFLSHTLAPFHEPQCLLVLENVLISALKLCVPVCFLPRGLDFHEGEL